MNEVSPSYFDIDLNGNLILNAVDTAFVNEMHEKGIKVVPFLSNHWDREIGRIALANKEKLAASISEAVVHNNLDGVNVDIENLTEEDREDYTEFVRILRAKLPAEKMLVVSVAANPYDYKIGWHGSYDYEELAENADYLMIMAYDEHYEGGEAGPVAGINFVEKSIQYALERVNKSKIVLGIPLYGRYWKEDVYYGGRAASLTQISDLIEKYKSKVIYDKESESIRAEITISSTDEKPTIFGKTLTNGTYIFWYENEDSIAAKLELINKYDIKGVGSWRLGLEEQSLWDIFKEKLSEGRQSFYDVPNDYWAKEPIEFIKEKNLIVGRQTNIYEPDSTLTRAEMVTIISRLLSTCEVDLDMYIDIKLNDIDGHWAEEDIKYIASLGIIEGYYDRTFKPDNPITRAETAKIISEVIKYVESNTETLSEFNGYIDLKERDWAYKYIKDLSQRGIMGGYPDGMVRPDSYVSRAEIAQMIYEIYQ